MKYIQVTFQSDRGTLNDVHAVKDDSFTVNDLFLWLEETRRSVENKVNGKAVIVNTAFYKD